MEIRWVYGIMWASMVWSSSNEAENPSGDYTGYGSLVRVRRKAADSTQLWPDAIVPYTFLEPQPSRSIVMSGLTHWQTHTCIKFTPVNNTEYPHLQFRKLSGCRSGVGIEGTSGQNISIGDNCNKLGIVVHEIGHALGFYHEIRRPDRDDHVVINEKNILKNELFNFYKLHWLDISIKYDLSSVMHYNPLEWSANERTTVATKDPMLQGIIGRWKQESDLGLSHRDKLLVNNIYGCLDRWLEKCNLNRNPCKNEGYMGEKCTCICAPGTTGRTCETITGGYYDDLKSPCSQEVKYPTYISSPNYPNYYDTDTWCVYRLQGEECQAPEVVVMDFQLGPKGQRDQCFHDYLEVRNQSLFNGFIKCGTDVARGTRWVASGSTMILYFKGAEGGHRGFKAKVAFNPIPGCCRTHANSSAFFLHTPGYPHPYTGDFNCTYSLEPQAPARVVVTVQRMGGSRSADSWTCALRLCQPHGRCKRHCREVIEGGSRKEEPKEIVLPNVASVHYMQYSGDYSPFRHEHAAFQVGFTLEDSPCHRIIIVNRTEPQGWITVGPRFFELLQCEWWLQAPRGSHVKVTLKDLHLPGHEDSYLAINEAGEATYPRETTRVYHDMEEAPRIFVSFEYKMSIVLQGDFITEVSLKYELYECADLDAECEYWAANDECKKNPYWMKRYCKRSCFQCEYTTICQDEHAECEFWATHEQCQENRLWMSVHCRKSCGYCNQCWDANYQCSQWADIGECEGNPDYMNQYCRKACGLCDDDMITETTTTPATTTTTTTTINNEPTEETAETTSSRPVLPTTHTNMLYEETFNISASKPLRFSKNRNIIRTPAHKTINQTFKHKKNKLNRFRNKYSKLSKDRFNRYKQNNVMLPPYGANNDSDNDDDNEDDEEEDGDDDDDVDDDDSETRNSNRIHSLFKKGKNLKKPEHLNNRVPKPLGKSRVPDASRQHHQTPTSLERNRTSVPNASHGSSTHKKRKRKKPKKKPRRPANSSMPQANRNPPIGEDISKLIALPLIHLKNATERGHTRHEPEFSPTETTDETGYTTRRHSYEEEAGKPGNPRQNTSSETTCSETDGQSCSDHVEETQNIVDNSVTHLFGIVDATSEENKTNDSALNLPSRRSKKREKGGSTRRKKNRNKKGRQRKNKTLRKVTGQGASRNVTDQGSSRNVTGQGSSRNLTGQGSSSRRNTDKKHRWQWGQKGPRNRTRSSQKPKKRKNISDKRRKVKHRGRNHNDGRSRRMRKQNGRRRDRGRQNTYRRRPGEVLRTTTSPPVSPPVTVFENFTTSPTTSPVPNFTPVLHQLPTNFKPTSATPPYGSPSTTTTEPQNHLLPKSTEYVTPSPFTTTRPASLREPTPIPTVTEYATTTTATSTASTTTTATSTASTTTTEIGMTEKINLLGSNTTGSTIEESLNVDDDTHNNQESNVINIREPSGTTSRPQQENNDIAQKHTHAQRRKNARKQRRQRKLNQQKLFNPKQKRIGHKNHLPKHRERHHRHKKNKRRNFHRKGERPRNQEGKSRGNKRRRNRYRSRHQNPKLNRTLTRDGSRISPPEGVTDFGQPLLTTASPPAPSSTSILPSPDPSLFVRTSETQTELPNQLHTMLQTEPETEEPQMMQEPEGMQKPSKTEADVPDDTETQLEVPGQDLEERPPKRSPEKYAEWGIGPLRSSHHPTRKVRPRWKFRRSFYRRDHIYEDIWPIFPRNPSGNKR